MGIFNNRYEIEVDVDGVELDYAPSNYSFSLHDSIYKFYPTASFKMNDIGGLYNEFMSFVNGSKIDITYGIDDEFLTCPFSVIKNSIPDRNINNIVGGYTDISLLHEYSSSQTKKSYAYKDEISSIVKKLVGDYNFSKVNIDSTLNKGYWYQPFIFDAEFIQNILLPFAYSSDSNETPFFSFIDVNNQFNFKNYKKMFDSSYVEELVLFPQGSKESLGRNAIISVYPYQSSTSILRPIYNQYEHYFKKDFSFNEEEKTIDSYITTSGVNLPIKADLSNITSMLELYSEDVKDESLKNNNRGLSINRKRDFYTNDKIVTICNLNTNLCSGKKVKVSIPLSGDAKRQEESIRYSGEYIIESSYHTWNTRSGSSTLVLSRQAVKLPDTYRNKKATISK